MLIILTFITNIISRRINNDKVEGKKNKKGNRKNKLGKDGAKLEKDNNAEKINEINENNNKQSLFNLGLLYFNIKKFFIKFILHFN